MMAFLYSPQRDEGGSMRFFKKNHNETVGVQVAPSCGSSGHPFSILNRYVPLSQTEMKLYTTLREAVPMIDAAICKTVRLLGRFSIVCQDKRIESQMNQFLREVQVNASGCGIEYFVNSYFDQLLTYGTAIGEIVPNIEGNDIVALYNVPLENVILKTGENPLELQVIRRAEWGKEVPIDFPQFVLLSTLNPDPGAIYGNSILKGLPFVSRILLNIYNSIGLNWERVGNVRFAVTYKPGQDSCDKAYAKDRAMKIAKEWSHAMHGDGVNDFIAVGDVDIKVIGADNQILDSQVPVRQLLEQILAKLSIPPFLLGVSWSTTETMSTEQADILTSEMEAYRRLLEPTIRKICSMWMKLSGNLSEYEVQWEDINLQDRVHVANARLMAAKAAEIEKKINLV